MYHELLSAGNGEFVQRVGRQFGFKSTRLTNVIAAMEAAQKIPGAQSLLALLNAMHVWRTQDPQEFANRGGTNGVAYRLWMEAKQALANRHHQAFPQPNPPMPLGCPGVTINGIYVPQAGHMEICHGFAFRWAVAAGKLPPNQAMTGPDAVHNGPNMLPLLYPGGAAAFPAARAGGMLQVQAGDIVGMFLGAALGHSLIAESPNLWFSANNVGSFGGSVGRSQINVNAAFGMFMGHQCGWVGHGNQWRRPENVIVNVIYRRIP